MNKEVIIRLTEFSTSQKAAVSKLYKHPSVLTDKVNKLHKALQHIIHNGIRLDVETIVDVSKEQIKDYYTILTECIDIYKKSNNVNSIPNSYSIYNLADSLKELQPISSTKQIDDLHQYFIPPKSKTLTAAEKLQNKVNSSFAKGNKIK